MKKSILLATLLSVSVSASADLEFISTAAVIQDGATQIPRYHIESARGMTLGGYAIDFDVPLNQLTAQEIAAYCPRANGPGAEIATISEVRAAAAYIQNHPNPPNSIARDLLMYTDDGFYADMSINSTTLTNLKFLIAETTNQSITSNMRGVFCSFPMSRFGL